MNTRSFLLSSLGVAALLAAPFTASAGEFPKGSPKFVNSYRKALSDAKAGGKPAIIIFSASWCPPCQAMKKEVYPSEAVKAYHDKFVWAYLDADDGQNKKPMEKYGVEGIPHIEFLNASGESVGKQVGGTEPEAFAKTLAGILEKAGAAPADKP